jgi:hypothetical protein
VAAEKAEQSDIQRPLALWPLLLLLILLGAGGLYGGIVMLIDPTGGLLQLTEVLPLLPVSDYILPGLFLLVAMGLAPVALTFGLLTRPKWNWAQPLSGWSRHHWAWTGTLGLGVTLAIWLFVQGLLIGFNWPIQHITAANGALIILLALTPAVRRFYAI